MSLIDDWMAAQMDVISLPQCSEYVSELLAQELNRFFDERWICRQAGLSFLVARDKVSECSVKTLYLKLNLVLIVCPDLTH